MKIRTGWILAAFAACLTGNSVAWAAQDSSDTPASRPADQFRLEVEVELVNVTATVLDPDGQYVEGLTADDFSIYEDGIEQNVAFFSHDQSVPISMGILVDTSGSMRHKIQQSLQTARELAMALSPRDEVFIVEFSDDINVLTEFTANGPHIQQIFRGIRTGGETQAFDAIGRGLELMASARHDKKILLLITDGFDTRSDLRADDIDELLRRSEVLVYAIGIDDDDTDPDVRRRTRYHVYHYMLSRITDVTGGRAFRLYTGRRYALQSLAEIILEELHQQYTLSYYPARSGADPSWREIRVSLEEPSSTVRHRAGYYMQPAVVATPE